ncbi:MAG: ATP synthase F0 subunit B [bacterium]|nr:ATP synthase F0 subunit B [bacterium]
MNFSSVIDYIARTNLFNFIIFAGVIVALIIKLDVKSKLDDAKKSIDESINESETVKTNSEEKLSAIEKSMENLSDEVDNILNQADENAKLVGNKITNDTKISTALIHENAQKVIENNRIILKNDIIRRATLASVEVAKSHIIEELKRNAELHNKLIDESINTIEGVEL